MHITSSLPYQNKNKKRQEPCRPCPKNYRIKMQKSLNNDNLFNVGMVGFIINKHNQ